MYPPQHSDTCWWRRYSSENGLESATLNQPQPPPPPKKKKKQPTGFGEANFHHQNPSLDPKLPRYIDERNKGTRRSRCCNCQAKTTEAHGIQWPGLMNRSRQTACGVASSETQRDFTVKKKNTKRERIIHIYIYIYIYCRYSNECVNIHLISI